MGLKIDIRSLFSMTDFSGNTHKLQSSRTESQAKHEIGMTGLTLIIMCQCPDFFLLIYARNYAIFLLVFL